MGGHGGLNILPQKRWNVYNFDNREKVKKDEEEQAEKDQQEKEECQQREGELRRLNLLNRAAKRRRVEESHEIGVSSSHAEASSSSLGLPAEEKLQHINLFEGFVEVGGMGAGNGSAQANSKSGKERKVPKAKEEDITHSLGFGALGKKGEQPWYLKASQLESEAADQQHFPLLLSQRSRASGYVKPLTASASPLPVTPPPLSSSGNSVSSTKKKRSIEELRAERVARESVERRKADVKLVAAAQQAGRAGGGRGAPPFQQGIGSREDGRGGGGAFARPPRYYSGFHVAQ
eukprot:TRINITY_DN18549_c0_g1_i1.p1 TRINITY_DN18549_c0_g1~~TRINITY_DN18549_c0_g1_i1.p1  ORF type:complete len:290 (-),score=76.72 TRINITY_DN18549_c0_g1_i1:662-1531(-)